MRSSCFVGAFAERPIMLSRNRNMEMASVSKGRCLSVFTNVTMGTLKRGGPEVMGTVRSRTTGLIRVSDVCCGRPTLICTGGLISEAGFSEVFCTGDNTRTGRKTVGLTMGCAKGDRVVSAISSFRKEAVVALTTANRRRCRRPFGTMVPRKFVGIPCGSLRTVGRTMGRGATTVVIRPVRNRNKIRIPSIRCLGNIRTVYGRGNVMFVMSRMRANFNEYKALFTRRLFSIGPSVVAVTGKVNKKIPVNKVLTARRITDTFIPNSRNAAFNNKPLMYTTTGTMLSRFSSGGVLSGMGRINRCFVSRLGGLSGSIVTSMHNGNLVINLRLAGPNTRCISGLERTKFLVGYATKGILEFIPPLVVAGTSVSRFMGTLGRVL